MGEDWSATANYEAKPVLQKETKGRFFSGYIIAILAAILFPVFAKAREKARQTACLSNAKQLGIALMQYVQDYDEQLPYAYFEAPDQKYGMQKLAPYMKNEQIWACPSGTTVVSGFYASDGLPARTIAHGWGVDQYHYPYRAIYSAAIKSLNDIKQPAASGVFFEKTNAVTTMPYVYCPFHGPTLTAQIADRHNDGLNVSFYDGHAKWRSKQSVLSGADAQRLWLHDNS